MDAAAVEERLRAAIRDVPDFPRAGILFRDITTLLLDPEAFRLAVEALAEPFREAPPERLLAVESRGFLFAGPLAYALGCGLAIARKPGKLPADTVQVRYQLEYGEDALEVHTDAIAPGHRVVVVDDLLATGGTARGAVELARKLGGRVVAAAFLLELVELRGRERLPDVPVHSVLRL